MRIFSGPFDEMTCVLGLSLVACSAGTQSTAPPASGAQAATSSPAVVAVRPPLPSGVPDTPAGRQLAWVLPAIASPPSEEDVTAHFTGAFLEKEPAAALVDLMRRMASEGPFVLERVTPAKSHSADELAAIVRSGRGAHLRIRLSVEPESGRIHTLYFQPKIDFTPAASWQEIEEAVRAVAPRVTFLAATIEASACVPIASLSPDTPMAVGSAFKLYVLDALAAQIASGQHSWSDPVPIQDALKSLPSGAMMNEPAGKTFSVRHYAQQMIGVSDNTAADHLIALVKRDAVEDAVKASGHAHPSLLQPFLTTREAFVLKLEASPDEQRAYVDADVARKRGLLEEFDHRDLSAAIAAAGSFTKPILIDSIEWLASAQDLCRVMLDLHARAITAAVTTPVAAILAKNPGIPDDEAQYAYVGYKGGSEPGVLNFTWLLQRARDGAWLFLTLGFNDPGEPIDERKGLTVAAAAREFLGR